MDAYSPFSTYLSAFIHEIRLLEPRCLNQGRMLWLSTCLNRESGPTLIGCHATGHSAWIPPQIVTLVIVKDHLLSEQPSQIQKPPVAQPSQREGSCFQNFCSNRHGCCMSHGPAVASPTQTTLSSLLVTSLLLRIPVLLPCEAALSTCPSRHFHYVATTSCPRPRRIWPTTSCAALPEL